MFRVARSPNTGHSSTFRLRGSGASFSRAIASAVSSKGVSRGTCIRRPPQRAAATYRETRSVEMPLEICTLDVGESDLYLDDLALRANEGIQYARIEMFAAAVLHDLETSLQRER